MSTPKRKPDLTILCSRKADTPRVAARVYAGVLVWNTAPSDAQIPGRPMVRDLREMRIGMLSDRLSPPCRACGRPHGSMAAQVLLGFPRGTRVTTGEVEHLSLLDMARVGEANGRRSAVRAEWSEEEPPDA